MSASVGQFAKAVVSGSVELVAAFAHLNFDFSLIKIEAPLEFQALGASLSNQRRDVAENGTTHVTARKLGALFEGLLPKTPRLVEVYGARTSHIAGSISASPQATSNEGIFSDYVGVDGTSIWAAATSGSGAISIHLLACMLARIWTASEATAIWMEIIEERKRELSQLLSDQSMDLRTVLAAQITLDRQNLAEWDNSARAWLRQADEAMKTKQTQLMLILNNIYLPVNSSLGTYASVVNAITSSLLAMEELLCGRPQSTQDGGLLLALSCWHIYPDMIVMGNQIIEQKDHLVPQDAKLTIGLENSQHRGQRGVKWSLSLAHLRYYGPPVDAERGLTVASGRLSFSQLVIVALGSMLQGWKCKPFEIPKGNSLIMAIFRIFETTTARKSNFCLPSEKFAKLRDIQEIKQDFNSKPNWIRMFAKAAENFQRSTGHDRELNTKLLALGQGRGASFLEDPKLQPTPVFGLSNPTTLIALLEAEEDRIAILRKYALLFFPNAKPGDIVIRYRPDANRKVKDSGIPKNATAGFTKPIETLGDNPHVPVTQPESKELIDAEAQKTHALNSQSEQIPDISITVPAEDEKPDIPELRTEIDQASDVFEYATAVPLGRPANEEEPQHYIRWIDPRLHSSPVYGSNIFPNGDLAEVLEVKNLPMLRLDNSSEELPPSFALLFKEVLANLLQKDEAVEVCHEDSDLNPEQDETGGMGSEGISKDHPAQDSAKNSNLETEINPQEFDFFWGHPNIAAIYVETNFLQSYVKELRTPYWASKKLRRPERVEIRDIESILDARAVSAQALDSYFRSESLSNYYTSLRALSFIQEIYQQLQHATIDPDITLSSLHSVPWLGDHYLSVRSYNSSPFSREQSFASIAMFETGLRNISLQSFTNVFAIACANSLFVAGPLLCDPHSVLPAHLIYHMVGNIGRPGVKYRSLGSECIY